MNVDAMLWACLLLSRRCRSTSSRAAGAATTRRARSSSAAAATIRASSRPTRAARAAGIRDDQLDLRRAGARARPRAARSRRRCRKPRALAQLATWALTFTPHGVPRAAERDRRRDRREPAPVRRPAAARRAPGRRRARAGLRASASASRPRRAPRCSSRVPASRSRSTIARSCRACSGRFPLALLDLRRRHARRRSRRRRHDVRRRPPRCRATALARRFGPHWSCDRSIARSAQRPIRALPFVPPPHVRRPPRAARARRTTSKRSASRVHRLVHDLADWLTARGLGAVRLTLTLAHERYLRAARRARHRSAVSRSARRRARSPHLHRRVARAAGARALPAPVEAMALASDETAPLAGRNLGLLPGDEADRRRGAARRSPARAARRGRGDARRAACRASARARAMREREQSRRSRRAHAFASVCRDAPRPLWLLAEPQPLGACAGTQPWVAARRPRAHRVGLVGRRRRAPRLLRRRHAARRNASGSIAITATASTTASGSCTGCLLNAGAALRFPRTTGSPGPPSSRPCRRGSSRSSRRARCA